MRLNNLRKPSLWSRVQVWLRAQNWLRFQAGFQTQNKVSRTFLTVVITAAVTFLLTLMSLTIDIDPYSYVSDWAISHGAKSKSDVLATIPEMPGRIIRSDAPPKILIDIKFKDIKKLEMKRSKALSQGQLIQEEGDFVPAKIRYLDKNIPAKLRLKGDWVDHLMGDKWSFRIHVRKNKHILGMRRFSIQDPATRGFQREPLFFETLKLFDVLTPRYQFIEVVINGKNIGIMALEEHFSKELLENNRRWEGVIVRFDETLLWKEYQVNGPPFSKGVFGHYQNAPIKAFRSSRVRKSKQLFKQYKAAVGLLRGFLNGKLEASQVFDTELLGAYLAVVQLWGSQHAVIWHNQRFYYNPISTRLEPIGFDASTQHSVATEQLVDKTRVLMSEMLKDKDVLKSYKRHLKELLNKTMNGELISHLQNVEKTHLMSLQNEYYFLRQLRLAQVLKMRAEYLLVKKENNNQLPAVVAKKKPMLKRHRLVHAYMDSAGPVSKLEIVNAINEPVEVTALKIQESGKETLKDLTIIGGAKVPFVLNGRERGAPQKGIFIDYRSPAGNIRDHIIVSAKLKGAEKIINTIAQEYSAPLTRPILPEGRLNLIISKHPYISINRKEKILTMSSGTWKVDSMLVVPEGYRLVIGNGVRLKFSGLSGIISYGAIDMSGTKEHPVFLGGIGSQKWLGLYVSQAKRPSSWSNVIIKNTSGMKYGDWDLTGGVTIYKSDIKMDSIKMTGSYSKDGLNIIQSQFDINALEVSDTVSDALDLDYSDGKISNSLFRDIGKQGGGDGIDISGSKVQLEKVRFVNVSDKAISVGERSDVEVNHMTAKKIGTAIASKDGSNVNVKSGKIERASIAGIMAYIKKEEFGPANISVTDLKFVDTPIETKIQDGSRATIDSKSVKTEKFNVEDLYKTVMKSGSKK